MLHRVKDLSPEQRLAIERLLGRKIADDEAVSVKTFETTSLFESETPLDRQDAAYDRLREYFAALDAGREPMTAEESASVIDEALRSTRPHYRRVK